MAQDWEGIHSHFALVLAVNALVGNESDIPSVNVTLSYQRSPKLAHLAAVIIFVVMPSPINMMTFFAFCEILVSRTVQLA